MAHKIVQDILQDLPFIKQIEWVETIQSEIKAVLPSNLSKFIRCSMQDNNLVILVENGGIARRILDYVDYIQPILNKYKLALPKILIIPNKYN